MSYLESEQSSTQAFLNGQRGGSSSENILNNVNLFTGNAQMPLSLAYLEGRDNLSITVQANYQAIPSKMFRKKNADCTSSVLGYNWSMPCTAILVGSRAVKQTYQSDFYCTDCGGEFPLYRIGRNEDAVEFLSIEHPLWKYYYFDHASPSYWVIKKEDGSTYTYGGSEDSNSLGVCWDNYVGSSMDTGGQNFTNGWYLSKIESTKGSRILYEYENVREPISNLTYTRTMRLSRLVSTYNEEVRFYYEAKDTSEYERSHNNSSGENAYQDIFEDKYLSCIDVYNSKQKLIYSQQLSYELIDSYDNEKKRLLTEIKQIDSDGTSMPPMRLYYSKDENLLGSLLKVEHPLTSDLEYKYTLHKVPVQSSETIYLERDWNKKIYNGSDFYVNVLTKNQEAKFQIHYWDMKWCFFEDNGLDGRSVDDINIYTGNGYVAITYKDLNTNSYVLRVLKRSPIRKFDWDILEKTLEATPDQPVIGCGSDFIAIQYQHQNLLKILQYKYTDITWHEIPLSVECADFQALGTGQGCLFGAYGKKNSNQVRLMSFYSDENHEWQQGDSVDVSLSVDWDNMSYGRVWSVSDTQASACFLAQEGKDIIASAVMIRWTDKFQFTKNQTLQYRIEPNTFDPLCYSIVSDNVIGYGEHVFRYCPNGWQEGELVNVQPGGQYLYSYGTDIALAVEKIGDRQRFYALRYDPYRNIWTDEGTPKAEDINDQDTICQPLVVNDFAILGRSVFKNTPDDTWEALGYLPDNIDFSKVQIDLEGKYILYQINGRNTVGQIPLVDGKIGETVYFEGECINTNYSAGYQSGRSSLYTFNPEEQASAIHLHQLYDKQYSEEYLLPMLDSITMDTGRTKDSYYMKYEHETMRIESNTASLQRVWVIPVSTDEKYGKTEYVYYNGASPERGEYPDDDEFSNAKQFYTHFCGQLYYTKEYDNEGKPKAGTKNWMKALDTQGFCIKQTKISDIKYLLPFDIENMTATDSLEREVASVIINEYESVNFLKKKSTKIGYDYSGKEKRISTELTYAWEENHKFKEIHDLTSLSKVVKKIDNTGEVLECIQYQYGINSSGIQFLEKELKWNGKGDYEDTSKNYICIGKTNVTDCYGQTIEEAGEDSILRTTIYDTEHKFVVANFTDAGIENVLYCGFEPYENMSNIQASQGKVEDLLSPEEYFSGTQSLCLTPGNKISFIVNKADGDYRLSYAVKSKGGYVISEEIDGKTISEIQCDATDNEWKTIRMILPNKLGASGRLIVSIQAEQKLFLDAVFLSPIASNGSSKVYTGDYFLQTAAHNNFDEGIYTLYSDMQVPIITASDDGKVNVITRKCYGKMSEEPNKDYDETLSIEIPELSTFALNRRCNDNSIFWTKNTNTWKFSQNDNYVILFRQKQGASQIEINDLVIEQEDRIVYIKKSEKIIKETALKYEREYLIIKIGNRIQVSVGGNVLYSGHIDLNKEIQLKELIDDSMEYIGYALNPRVKVSYSDYSGKSFQDLAVVNDGIIVNGTVYSALGQPLVSTKSAHFRDEIWEYRKDFIKQYDWDTGVMSGEIAEQYPEDNGFPYNQILTSQNPNPEAKAFAQCGKEMSLYGDEDRFVKFESYANGSDFGNLLQNHYYVSITENPDYEKKVLVADSFGNMTYQISTNNDGNKQITQYEYDNNGKITKIYYPNYFSNIEGHDKYVSECTYDFFGHMKERKDPDSATIKTIYNQRGQLRFTQPDGSNQWYQYTVYDRLGRQVEIGRVNESWNETELIENAELVGVIPPKGIAIRRFFYDGDGTDLRKVGKCTTVITYSENQNQQTIEEYEYDTSGNLIRKVTKIGDYIESVCMEYNREGTMVAYWFEDRPESKTEYVYDLQSKIIKVLFKGKSIYQCNYLPTGNLSEEVFSPDLPGEIHRSYEYNSTMWLTKIKDNCFEQEINYFDGGDKDSLYSGKITACKSRFITDIPSNVKKEMNWKYSYDAYGRVVSAREGESIYMDLSYDSNGNLIKQNNRGIDYKYKVGTNQLVQDLEKEYTYNETGNVVGVSNQSVSISYDSVLNRVNEISNNTDRTEYFYGMPGVSCYLENGNPVYCSYDNKGRLIAEKRGDKRVLIVYGANGILAQIADDKVYYLIKDYQSSVRGIYDGEKLCAAINYSPLGSFIGENYLSEEVGLLIPLFFTSCRYDSNYNLYIMKNRIYDPSSGRFFNLDPEDQFASPYVYAGADWINYFDPDGAFAWGSFLSIVAGVALVVAGAAISIASAGIASPVGAMLAGLGGAFVVGAGIGAAMYGITSAISGDFRVTDLLINVAMGGAFGMLGAGAGAVVSTIASPIVSGLVDFGIGVVIGGVDSVVSNGLLNISHDMNFFDNVGENLAIGCALGGAASAFAGLGSALRTTRNLHLGPRTQRIGVTDIECQGCTNHIGIYKPNSVNGVTQYSAIDCIPFANGEARARFLSNQHVTQDWFFYGDPRTELRVPESVDSKFYIPIVPEDTSVSIGKFSILRGPNCTTFALGEFAKAGLNAPIWVRWPGAFYQWARAIG